MSTLFAGMEVAFIRVSAVDGKKLTQREIDGWLAGEGNFYHLGPGEVGCFLSHRKCWEFIAEGEDSHSAIFEDDLHFGAGLKDVLVTADWIPNDADIVKLETTLTRTLYQRRQAATIAGRTVRRLHSSQFGSGGYIISRPCAKKLVEESKKIADPVDQFIFNNNLSMALSLKIYHLVPAICIQDLILSQNRFKNYNIGSELSGERPKLQETLRRKILREIQRPIKRISIRLKASLGGMEWKKIPIE
ncbi:glycosyl transferase family 25 [Aquamicrobium terrae]|uniref:Glycosyl transferase family 25 n=2 Tax=Aquamicrobium terrae TaxID=1324945 RepID=A0ABV2N5P8_9HYPH